MKKNQLVTLGIVGVFVAAIIGVNMFQPSRISEQRMKEQAEAQHQLDEANKPSPLLQPVPMEDPAGTQLAANTIAATAALADPFQVEFQCSNGTFVVEVYPEWAPLGAAQFKEIIEAGIYNEARFFRALPNFVVQWGIPGDPEQAAIWGKKTIQDDPVKTSNVRGTITYATSGPNSRSSQVFINLNDDNTRLDDLKFAPFGKVVKGMEVVDAIYNGYREGANEQEEIEAKGNAFLKEYFPKLDYIKEAKILGTVAAPASSAPEVAQESAPATPELATQN